MIRTLLSATMLKAIVNRRFKPPLRSFANLCRSLVSYTVSKTSEILSYILSFYSSLSLANISKCY